ncbi:MAG: DUF4101 domain-containing protein, partial [Synechococcaceae bacterium WB8_1B_136]|nr:DUF4101 domain-containing protein [Synechococcaceae bacterium WB8_1B_136]
AGLCAYCRDWLSRDVLPGFRDLEAEPDLEAWFADRDVQAYVEQQDRIRSRITPGAAAATATATTAATESHATPASLDAPPIGGDDSQAASTEEPPADADDDLWDEPFWSDWSRPSWLRLPQLSQLPRWTLPAGAAAVLLLAGGGWWLLRPRPAPVRPIPVEPLPEQPAAPNQGQSTPQPRATPQPAPAKPAATPSLPLSQERPSQDDLKALLNAWLAAKASVLAGGTSSQPLADLARPSLVSRLESQQAENRQSGARELVNASISSFQISEQSPIRIAADVSLRYSDERRSAEGRLLSSTPATELRNTYVFARDGGIWRLAAFRPSP